MPRDPLVHTIPAPGDIRLHCLEWRTESDDAPVVFLHGGGAHAHWWTHLVGRLAYRGPRFALDFRGHGDSDFPEEREVGAFNLDLEALLSWLGRDDVHLIGHSMGAAVAFDHASRFPATRSVVLIDLARGSERGSGRRARLALALRRTYATREEAIQRFRFLPESSHADESLRLSIARRSVREEPDGRFGYKFDPAWFGLPSRPRPDPADVRCPVLLVRGGDSRLLSQEAAEELARVLPRGSLAVVPDAGHHVAVDQPDRLLDAIAAFVEREGLAPGDSA
ncbi:MAG: alpha/beta hydrolase [bacterium]|nr:alpha/beta hydrolase [bacterium]